MQINALNNRFFQSALEKASRFLGKPGRIILLLSTFARKLKQSNFTQEDSKTVKTKFFILGRILKAYAQGEYRIVPWKSLLMIVAAVLYFINPIDLIPDLLPLIGLTDDFAVLLMVYKSVGSDIEKFLIWEEEQIAIPQ